MIAVVPVRQGELPVGAAEAVAAAGGFVIVAGEGTKEASSLLAGRADLAELSRAELGSYQPGRWAASLAGLLAGIDVVVLPGVPDGRDLAPRLALVLKEPLVSNAVSLRPGRATVVTHGGRRLVELSLEGPFVATLQPSGLAPAGAPPSGMAELEPTTVIEETEPVETKEALSVALYPPDPATMDLAEAPRIVAGGAGLGEAEAFLFLAEVGRLLGASVGGTRMATDAGQLPHDRQIGTTGVAVRPRLYLAFGVSGAAQHLAGIGEPVHVVSVNLDESCPMMARADLAIVAEARETLRAIADRLGSEAARG